MCCISLRLGDFLEIWTHRKECSLYLDTMAIVWVFLLILDCLYLKFRTP